MCPGTWWQRRRATPRGAALSGGFREGGVGEGVGPWAGWRGYGWGEEVVNRGGEQDPCPAVISRPCWGDCDSTSAALLPGARLRGGSTSLPPTCLRACTATAPPGVPPARPPAAGATHRRPGGVLPLEEHARGGERGGGEPRDLGAAVHACDVAGGPGGDVLLVQLQGAVVVKVLQGEGQWGVDYEMSSGRVVGCDGDCL